MGAAAVGTAVAVEAVVGIAVPAPAVAREVAVGSSLGVVGADVGTGAVGLGREPHAATAQAALVASRPLINFLRFNMAVILSLR